jgi:Tol biopolymer transport system component
VRRTLSLAILLLAAAAQTTPGADSTPWWKQQKIRFMWGAWAPTGTEVPDQVMKNAALCGTTVFAELWVYNEADARKAKRLGMRYFAGLQARYPLWDPAGRAWVDANGKSDDQGSEGKYWVKCPLEDAVHERWLVAPILKGVQEGIVDGVSVDWEAAGYAATPCYCDDCFAKFLESKGINEPLPGKANRFGMIKARDLVQAYDDDFHRRRLAMFVRLRERLQAANPAFLFASYDMLYSDFTRALSTPKAPFIILDARHYSYDDRKPWWESYSQRLRQEGYLYIPGGWDNAVFGCQPSQVSAAQWIYETSINEDGFWMWWEHELTDDMLRAYSSADQRIRMVQDHVGRYLFNGKRDYTFVTMSEWTGRPELQRALLTCTYHLGNDHLLQVNNVNTEWALRVRLRFPRLEAGRQWTLRDALSDQYYSKDGTAAVWATADLRAGVVVPLEPRTDLYLLLSPAGNPAELDTTKLLVSREFEVNPDWIAASAKAGAVKSEGFVFPKNGWKFRMDAEDAGIKANWADPATPLEGWVPLEIESFWGGRGGVGAGWYRRDVDIPALPEGKPVYMKFGAVDEELMLWIDGQPAGGHNIGPAGWDQPFVLDVTGKLTPGRHHIAMRVYNSAQAGGIWKPISVTQSPNLDGTGAGDVLDSPAGRILYTATEILAKEQQAFEPGCGKDSLISNTVRAVNGDGTGETRLRQVHGNLWSPAYSPDGRTVAFVHDTWGRGQVFVMDAGGSVAVNLSNNSFCDRSPAWSPDGSRLAFLTDRDGDWDIWVMNADGSDQKKLAGNPGLDYAPAWSPDGMRLAWESQTSGIPNIWVCDSDGRNPHPVITPDKPPRLQEVRGWQTPIETADIHPSFPDSIVWLADPVWSPDSTRIACYGLTSGSMVAILDADGSRLLELVPWIAGADNLCWSPDGKQIAGTLRTAPQESDRSGVFTVKTDGSANYQWLVDVTPQGPRLGGALRQGLMTWYSNGTAAPRRVVKTFDALRWSPDGSTLAFTSDLDPSGAFYVYTIPAGGGTPARLDSTKSAWPNELQWKPR